MVANTNDVNDVLGAVFDHHPILSDPAFARDGRQRPGLRVRRAGACRTLRTKLDAVFQASTLPPAKPTRAAANTTQQAISFKR